MSDTVPTKSRDATTDSFVGHARLIGLLTLVSRVTGLAREVVAGHFLGTGLVASAFTVAFTIPNLFRKLLGEGALAQAFIPLYAQARKRGSTETGETPERFAAASVKLLVIVLVLLTLVGEAILIALIAALDNTARPDRLLMLQFAAVMLPYVLLVCGGAFLSAILQVHKRFGPPAFAPVLLNIIHISVVVGAAYFLGLSGKDVASDDLLRRQTQLAFCLAVGVLVAGVLQVMVLMPALRAIGFRIRFDLPAWTPDTRRMLQLSIPVALGAGVLQLSVLLDKGIAMGLMQRLDHAGQLVTHFTFLGQNIAFPMEMGAPRRLDMAQYLYQFPLGIFAIALATAIFPGLSADALDKDRHAFKSTLRTGIVATLWESLPASVGLILVCEPAARLLFQHGQLDAHSAGLIAQSTMWYAGAIWAFSLLQIINRAYYATHDTMTPLVMSAVNIVINLVVEIPLLWWMGESAMAAGTLVSFIVQALLMLWMLDRRTGGLELRTIAGQVVKILIATAGMLAVCVIVRKIPGFPTVPNRLNWTLQLSLLIGTGAGTYLTLCWLLRVPLMASLVPKRLRRGMI